MTDSRPLPRKKDVTLLLLEGPSVYIHLDPRRDGVVVPKWLAGQPQLVLQIGLNMPVPIPDLHVDDEGVSCTLSFNRSPFWCKLPWSAVYAVVGADQRGMVWPDDVPSEVAAQLLNKPPQARPSQPKADEKRPPQGRPVLGLAQKPGQPQARKRPTLEALDGGAGKPDEPARPEPEAAPAPAPAPVPSPALAPAPEPAEKVEADEAARTGPEPAADEPKTPSPSPRPGAKPKRELPPYLRVIK